MPQIAVVVLAAGAGTRMRSATPKPLHAVAGRSLIAHVLHTAHELEPTHLVAVVRHERDLLVEEIAHHAPSARIADQDDVPGTGRAVEAALAQLPDAFDGLVVVLSGDVPLIDSSTLRELVREHEEAQNALTVLSTRLPDPTGFGRIIRGRGGQFQAIVEERDADEPTRAIDEVNGGIYVFGAVALRTALAALGTDNDQGEKYLTDAALRIQASGGRIEAVPIDDHWLVAGVNDRAQLSDVALELNRRIVRRWQLAGVTIVDPASTWIDADVSLEPDVTILPGTQLHGATSIARGATIGPDTTVTDTEVGEDAVVRRSDVTLAVVGARASVGPFSFLRAGTILGADGKIGAAVETKNATIGDGSKVPHLSYVGDAEIGEGVNLGAGTITANYDDVRKHRTIVGDHVHTSSHTVLVAPVELGAGAKTAAGAVVRKDVPPGALAMTVAPQRNVGGWVQERRPGTAAADAADRAIAEQAQQTTAHPADPTDAHQQ
ncbi:bifunctional UDP-N-acetylglucosamine diphosphorylase/glucosamine-1-phosphate N-acetyltransferase GlmU [Agrococcus versicolor]|uniref:Bifunctional protein GlmU n=1 Tax=Agrococcus versicolor TaxID=501482 RepID=A0ABN3AKP3_9MICO